MLYKTFLYLSPGVVKWLYLVAFIVLASCGKMKNWQSRTPVSPSHPNYQTPTAHHQTVNMFSKHCPGGGQITISAQVLSSSSYPSPELQQGNSATVSGVAPCGSLGLLQFSCQARAEVGRGGFRCHSGTLHAPAHTTAYGHPISWHFEEGQAHIYNNGQRLGGWIIFRSSQRGSCLLKLDC